METKKYVLQNAFIGNFLLFIEVAQMVILFVFKLIAF